MAMSDWQSRNLLSKPATGTNRQRIRDLLRKIASFTVHPSNATLWRGHSTHHYRVTPSIARGGSWKDPACTQEEFKHRLVRLHERSLSASRFWRDGLVFRGLSPLEQLEHLQHHGGGTPLVDLTPDPMVALWMASESAGIAEEPNPNHGLLIGFNVDARWIDVSEKRLPLLDLLEELKEIGSVGFALPPVINDRIVVQRSRFLVSRLESEGRWHEGVSDVWLPDLPVNWTHGTAEEKELKLANIFEPTQGRPTSLPVLAFAIPGNLKDDIQLILANHYGVSRETVYPDAFDGVVRAGR